MKVDSPIHVAFADDFIAVRKGIITYLERTERIKVTIEASDGLEMLSKLRATKQLPEVCIIDINMPHMRGTELLPKIREHWPEIGCLVLSGYREQTLIENVIQLGANGYLYKDCDPQQILDAIMDIRHNGFHFSVYADEKLFSSILGKELKVKLFKTREIEFFGMLSKGMEYREIANELCTTESAIKSYKDRLFHKYNVNSRDELIVIAMKNGLLEI